MMSRQSKEEKRHSSINPISIYLEEPFTVKPSKCLRLYFKNEIESNMPYLTIEKNFPPAKLAESLISRLQGMNEVFSPSEFYIAGNKSQSKHLTAFCRGDDSFVGVSYLAGEWETKGITLTENDSTSGQ